jgi:hypothetical protein
MEVAVDRVEVVPDPERIEAEPIREQRVLAQRLPGGVLGPEIDAEMHGCGSSIYIFSRARLARWPS